MGQGNRAGHAANFLTRWSGFDRPQSARSRRVVAGRMHETFELYYKEQDGQERFEAFTCLNTVEAMSVVREKLARSTAESVDVRVRGSLLFTLVK